jgi:hypothetical protein
MPDFVGYLIIKGLRGWGSEESTPEWKEFIKPAGFGGGHFDDGTDIQFVVLFGMLFGPGKPK